VRRRSFRALIAVLVVLLGAGSPGAVAAPRAADSGAAAQQHCALPAGDSGFESAAPESVALDPAAVREAIAYANTHLRASVQVFRNNCRVATGALDPVTGGAASNVWSSTKSVISMLTGIAAARGELGLDDPVGEHLPTGAGWGDPAHRAITIRQLLTETSGLDEAILSEGATTGLDPDVCQEALAQPLTHRPGTHFEYGQRTPDLLACAVQRAVGTDLQDYAQRHLFDPLGVPRSSYFWLRDRSGQTYGYAHLFIPPEQYAKLGLLMQNGGEWHGRQVVPADYVRQVGEPTRTNGCYGLLFWTNRAQPCTSANLPSAQTVQHRMIPSAPPDLYAMVGALQQNNFVIPSLDMTVTWTGAFGDTTPHPGGALSGNLAASDLYHNFFRILMKGVRDAHVPDPGPYTAPPIDFTFDPRNFAAPSVLLRDLAPNPSCNVVVCDGTVPTRGLAQNGEAIARNLLGGLPAVLPGTAQLPRQE
jgi:CubicO group peptidase (beta-lactamase class C family)